MKAMEIMTKDVITVTPEATVKEIVKLVVEHKISGVPVVDAAGKLVGIVTEGDLLHKEVAPRLPDVINILGAIIYFHGVKRYHEDFKKLMAGTAQELMTAEVITVGPEADADAVGELMISRNIKRVPVINAEGKLLGIISRADIVKMLLD